MNRRELLTAAGAAPLLFLSGAGTALSAQSRAAGGDPAELTLAQASRAIRDGRLSCVDLVHACLRHIDAANPMINAVITPMRGSALAQAAALDAEARAGKFRSPLHGIPIGLKDNIDTAGTLTTNASALHKDRVPAEDARVVEQLKQSGAIIIAKANLAEFAVSPTNATSYYGPVRNPWNPDHVSGGSSGGSAAALAARMCVGALGTDSGGSVRIPSAWCGMVGLKPTVGLVPFSGIGPGILLLDTCGPLARTVEDVALMFNHMPGYDPRDVMSVDRPREDYVVGLGRSVAKLRVGVPRRPFFDQLDGQIAEAVETALAVIATLVGSIKDVTLKGVETVEVPAYDLAEVYSYHGAYFPKQRDAYQPRTRSIMQYCADFLNGPARGLTSRKMAEYIQTRTAILRSQRTIDTAFDSFDVVAMPTMKSLPPTVNAAVDSEYASGPGMPELFSINNTVVFNIVGLPSLSVPCGFSREGLPVGLMICGPRFSEANLLALGAAYQRSTPWHERRPG